jgi:hypothetical protein
VFFVWRKPASILADSIVSCSGSGTQNAFAASDGLSAIGVAALTPSGLQRLHSGKMKVNFHFLLRSPL